jgi:hypothetical protein
MNAPTTPAEWWDNLNEVWSDIIDIFIKCGAPMTYEPRGCIYSDGVGEPATLHEKPLLRVIESAREERNHEVLLHWLNLCWLAAPDKPYIHTWPSWYTLCDLCSECWVFDEPLREETP